MYMIMRFQDQLQHELVQSKASKGQTTVNFDEILTRLINAQEHKVSKNNALSALAINSDFETSFILTTT